MNFNIPALDVQGSNNGRWFDWKYGISCKIARHGNPEYSKRLLEILDAHVGESDATEVATEIVAMSADTILLDFKGLTDGEKEPTEIPYSREVAIELLTAEEFIEFQTWVELTSKKMSNFYKEKNKEVVKP